MITLEPIVPEVALIFKAVRLRALQDSPTVFSSTYAKESEISDEEWFQRSVRWSSRGSVAYLAFVQGKPCGMVACYTGEQDPLRAQVVSMCVDPEFRRGGVGSALIEGLRAWAGTGGVLELKLMVTSVNRSAIEFYERVGFRM